MFFCISLIFLIRCEWCSHVPFPPPSAWQEFEVIAQIKLLQLASNNYSFTQDSHFREWFAGVEKLSEAERSVRFLPCRCSVEEKPMLVQAAIITL